MEILNNTNISNRVSKFKIVNLLEPNYTLDIVSSIYMVFPILSQG
jgi:hypothetical protein